ncbi:MAG TPA: efflux RND transporter periplasmic adaptor subunit [Candidatus Polarisedimenticolaceae bacterium]|nr:efflux RND transporter periplasmic adaptor subunit [Candidatus Polarisedimenticolaceae bacterium]
MKRKILIAVSGLLGVVLVLAGVKALQIRALIKAGAEMSIPPETISAAEVRQETWESLLPAVGSVTAVQGVELRAELAGTVRRINFESGGTAAAGQVLVQLDTSMEEAQLRATKAQAELARQNLARAVDLRAQGVIAQSDFDTAQAAANQTTGQVDTIQATIAKKTIRAPFAGRLGIRSVNLGQFVHDGDPIVSLHSLDPVFVDFTLPEQQLGQVQRAMAVRVTTDATPGRTFNGKVTALNPEVDPSTRNVKVQATVANAGGELRPGMFARVVLVLPETQAVLVVPSTAVLHAPYGDSVFVVSDVKDEKSGKTVKQVQMTTVRLGETRGDFVNVTNGLKAGQTIASSGVFKLRNGSPVAIDNSLAPDAQSAPRPPNS